MSVITRFAPSPTGFLHIGGARTALYCWLYARKMKGKFILRVEDTDRERSTPESVQAILDGMAWLNLQYDAGPFYQTQHMKRYQEVIELLLSEGKAYRCYCSKERLEQLRNDQISKKEKPRYDGVCRSKNTGSGAYVVRFKNPTEGVVEFEDVIRGKLSFQNTELDDLIIARTDGSPTYNFTVVVDDLDMNITHVIRGDDHINNTPRQINIFKALNAPIPHYAHLPMILGPDGKRLSKREGAASVLDYQMDGILPEALLNYLVRLGWSHGDQEIFSIDEMIEFFEIKNIHKSPAALNPDKLLWLNQYYLKTKDEVDVAKLLKPYLVGLQINIEGGPDLSEVVKIQRERVKTLKEMAERSRFFYEEPASAFNLSENKDLLIPLTDIRDQLKNLATWAPESIHQVLAEVADAHQLKLGKIAQPIRLLVTGGTVSPPIDATLCILGQEKTIQRLSKAIA